MKAVTKDNIKSILLAGESNTVEFKAKVGTLNILPRIISAFANTEGGVIIIGYDERSQFVIGASNDDFKRVRNIISHHKLEDVCNAYTIQYEGKTLIIIQVEKTKTLVIAGGGAYIRRGDSNISVLTSKDVVARIESNVKSFKPDDTKEVIERLEKVLTQKIEQIYDEMLRSQKEHEKELKDANRSNWFFCILSAVIGAVLGVVLGLFIG